MFTTHHNNNPVFPLFFDMMEKIDDSVAASSRPPRGGKLLRRSNSERLRMHAPSSIRIADPTKTRVEEGWKIAIPLLSPLDPTIVLTGSKVEPKEADAVVKKSGDEIRPTSWKHPAAPFYYEPVPTNVTPFLLK